MECLISINLFPLETWRKDSPLRRFSNLPQTKNKRLVSLTKRAFYFATKLNNDKSEQNPKYICHKAEQN